MCCLGRQPWLGYACPKHTGALHVQGGTEGQWEGAAHCIHGCGLLCLCQLVQCGLIILLPAPGELRISRQTVAVLQACGVVLYVLVH